MAQATAPTTPRRGLTLTQQIFIGLVLGIIVGAIVDATHPSTQSISVRSASCSCG
jgi:Na+/H+-dicarboxylate symporter